MAKKHWAFPRKSLSRAVTRVALYAQEIPWAQALSGSVDTGTYCSLLTLLGLAITEPRIRSCLIDAVLTDDPEEDESNDKVVQRDLYKAQEILPL